MALELDGQQRRRLREALIDAFPGWGPLERMVSDTLDLKLATIASEAKDLQDNAFDLIEWGQSRGRLGDVVRGARYANPDNPKLFVFAQQIGITSTDAPKSALEAFVSPNTTFLDVAVWRAELSRLEWKVCRVDVDGVGVGTGFLVGPDAVLTNHHVAVRAAANGSIDPGRLSCLFDYKMAETEVLSTGIRYGLVGDGAVLALSPHSPHDLEPDPKSGQPSDGELDLALLRLAEPAGELPAGGFAEGQPRHWLTLDPEPVDFSRVNQLAILQHPETMPLKLAFDGGQQIELNEPANNRIRYTVNTLPGSSGSPVFDSDWRLVALHHSGDPDTIKPEYNEGIPISAIAREPAVEAFLAEVADLE